MPPGPSAVGTYPLHPGMLQDLCSAQPLLGVAYQELRDEVFGSEGDVGPVLLRKLILALLNALEQHILGEHTRYGQPQPRAEAQPPIPNGQTWTRALPHCRVTGSVKAPRPNHVA